MVTLEIPAPEFVRRFQAGEIPNSASVVVTYEPVQPGDVAAPSETLDGAATAGAELEAERGLFEPFESGIEISIRVRLPHLTKGQ